MSGKKPAHPSRRDVLRAAGLVIGAAATSSLGPTRAEAARYPDRTVRIIVPFAPAGPTDIMARILGNQLGGAIGGTVITENRPGAGGNIGGALHQAVSASDVIIGAPYDNTCISLFNSYTIDNNPIFRGLAD